MFTQIQRLFLQHCFDVVIDLASFQLFHHILVLHFHDVEELLLKLLHLVLGDLAQQTVGAAEDDGHLLLDGHRGVLRLFQ